MFNAEDERMPRHSKRMITFTTADSLYRPFCKQKKKDTTKIDIPIKVKCKSCPALILSTTKTGHCRRCEEKLRREKLLSIIRNNNLISERDALTVGNPKYLLKHNDSFKPHQI